MFSCPSLIPFSTRLDTRRNNLLDASESLLVYLQTFICLGDFGIGEKPHVLIRRKLNSLLEATTQGFLVKAAHCNHCVCNVIGLEPFSNVFT